MITTILTYLFQVGICLAVFYLFYKSLFSKDTFYKLNRTLILGVTGLSFILPILPWTNLFSLFVAKTSTLNNLIYTVNLEELIVGVDSTHRMSWWGILLSIYFIGLVAVLIGVCVEFFKLYRFIKGGTVHHREQNIKVLTSSKEDHAPFSWMSNIFISEEDLASCGEEIILHEKAHIYYKHSWDVLLMNAVLVIQWFNPAAWLLKRELEVVHEYQADAYVLRKGINAQKYQLLLIKKSVGDYMFNLANSFNHSHLTKRITMMLKKKSSRWASLKLMYMLPALVMIAFVFGCSNAENKEVNTDKQDTELEAANLQDELVVVGYGKSDSESAVENKKVEGEVFTVVEVQPEFPGGVKELMRYLGSYIKYPAVAQEAGIQGRVIVQFVVGKDGSIINPKIIRGVDSSLDNEAIRVVQSMPSWTPGKQKGQAVNVKYTLPVTFRLQ